MVLRKLFFSTQISISIPQLSNVSCFFFSCETTMRYNIIYYTIYVFVNLKQSILILKLSYDSHDLILGNMENNKLRHTINDAF